MIGQLKRIAFVVAVALGCPGAQAALYTWGTHATFEFSGPLPVAVAPGNFLDFWTFTITQAQVMESSVVNANNNPPAFGISAGSYALYNYGGNGLFDSGGGDDAVVGGAWSFDGTTGSTSHPALLSAGNYYFSVTGNATGTSGGRYAISSQLTPVAPVPAPDSFPLLAAGLGLLGFMAWRRRQAETGDRCAIA